MREGIIIIIMEADVEKVIKEYAAMDAMASEILSDKQQVCSAWQLAQFILHVLVHFMLIPSSLKGPGDEAMFHRALSVVYAHISQIVDLDGRRNKGREALRKLKENQGKGM